MAINPQGQVTTTGMMNNPGMNVEAPDMRNLAPPQQNVEAPAQMAAQPVDNTPREVGIVERLQNLTADDMIVLEPILSPSVKTVLAKIIPEISSLLEGVGTDEETVPIKASVFTSLPEDIQNFIIQSSTDQMDTNNVPLDTSPDTSGMMARQEPEIPQTSEGDMDYSQIDEGLIS
tara:strand:- start:43 stop:567 length:525 start_codon:yes stop_codon:yes gene_type:complete